MLRRQFPIRIAATLPRFAVGNPTLRPLLPSGDRCCPVCRGRVGAALARFNRHPQDSWSRRPVVEVEPTYWVDARNDAIDTIPSAPGKLAKNRRCKSPHGEGLANRPDPE